MPFGRPNTSWSNADLNAYLAKPNIAGAGGISLRTGKSIARRILAARAFKAAPPKSVTGAAGVNTRLLSRQAAGLVDLLAIKQGYNRDVVNLEKFAVQFLQAQTEQSGAAFKAIITRLARDAFAPIANPTPEKRQVQNLAKDAFTRAFKNLSVKRAYDVGKARGYWDLNYSKIMDDIIGVSTVIGVVLGANAIGGLLSGASQAGTTVAAEASKQTLAKTAETGLQTFAKSAGKFTSILEKGGTLFQGAQGAVGEVLTGAVDSGLISAETAATIGSAVETVPEAVAAIKTAQLVIKGQPLPGEGQPPAPAPIPAPTQSPTTSPVAEGKQPAKVVEIVKKAPLPVLLGVSLLAILLG